MRSLAFSLMILVSVPAYSADYEVSWDSGDLDLSAVTSSGDVSSYYAYGAGSCILGPNTPDALEAADTITVFVHEGTDDPHLVVLLDSCSGGGGSATIDFDGLGGVAWTVQDDPARFDIRDSRTTTGTVISQFWQWNVARADGGAVALDVSTENCVNINVQSTTLSTFELVQPDGSGGFTRTAVPLSETDDVDLCVVLDSDEDGVDNVDDDCPDTAFGDTVDDVGCSIADYCPCDDPWRHRGEYLWCVVKTSHHFRVDGLISWPEKVSVLRDALGSDCGCRAY